MKDLKWYVYHYDVSSNSIKPFNIFDHCSFREDVEKYLKKYNDKEEFTEKLRSSLMYYFWSRCEYEVIITSFPTHITTDELNRLNCEMDSERNWVPIRFGVDLDVGVKIDIYDQVRNNWDVFVDYVYNSKTRRPRKKRMIEEV